VFQAVDLRWGVSRAAAENLETMRICLGEIDRCRAVTPGLNFIALLGDRYGWRPPPYVIPGAEFAARQLGMPLGATRSR
jgi:NACHT domain- and WD repeat-containing protein